MCHFSCETSLGNHACIHQLPPRLNACPLSKQAHGFGIRVIRTFPKLLNAEKFQPFFSVPPFGHSFNTLSKRHKHPTCAELYSHATGGRRDPRSPGRSRCGGRHPYTRSEDFFVDFQALQVVLCSPASCWGIQGFSWSRFGIVFFRTTPNTASTTETAFASDPDASATGLGSISSLKVSYCARTYLDFWCAAK